MAAGGPHPVVGCRFVARRDSPIDNPLPEKLEGKKVAVVGSGPAGMAAAQQLRRAGHRVTHQRHGLAEQEDLDFVPRLGQRVAMQKRKRRLGRVVRTPRTLHQNLAHG